VNEAVLCSKCFRDQGLRLDSFSIGIQDESACANCGSTDGRKLSRDLIARLAHRFFVRGTTHRTHFGAAPIVQFNEHQTTSIRAAPWFEPDLRLIEKAIGVGFFYYGPHLWMIGDVEPLKALERPDQRATVVERILAEYPDRSLSEGELFYRLRRDPREPSSPGEYDLNPA